MKSRVYYVFCIRNGKDPENTTHKQRAVTLPRMLSAKIRSIDLLCVTTDLYSAYLTGLL